VAVSQSLDVADDDFFDEFGAIGSVPADLDSKANEDGSDFGSTRSVPEKARKEKGK